MFSYAETYVSLKDVNQHDKLYLLPATLEIKTTIEDAIDLFKKENRHIFTLPTWPDIYVTHKHLCWECGTENTDPVRLQDFDTATWPMTKTEEFKCKRCNSTYTDKVELK